MTATLVANGGCDQPAVTNAGSTLQSLNNGLLLVDEAALDGILDGLENRTYTLAFRRREAADPEVKGGLDPAASNLHTQLLGHLPGDTLNVTDANATVPRLCARVSTLINTLGNAVAPTPLERDLVALAVCRGLDTTIDAMLAANGDLDKFLEREVVPNMKGSRNDGDCKGYVIAAATLDFKVKGVDLTPNLAETKLAMRIDDPVLRVTEGTYQVSQGSGKHKVCVDRTLVGAKLAIDGRLDLTFRMRGTDAVKPFPWREACGQKLYPYSPAAPETATVPRDLAHGRLTVELDTRAEITHIDLDSQGLFVDWAVQFALNHTKQIRCAIAGVGKDACEHSTEAARTIDVAHYDTILTGWGAVLEHLRWESVNNVQRFRFDSRAGLDPDHDLVLTGLDNCPNHANANQRDGDIDGVGDVCDPRTADSSEYQALLLRQQLMNCDLLTLSDTFDPLRTYPALDKATGDVMVQAAKQYWKLQARDFGFDWSVVVIDEQPERMFATQELAFAVTRQNLAVLAQRWNMPALRLLPLKLVKVGTAQRVALDPAAQLPKLTPYQQGVLELAVPDRLVP